jgi:two-component system, NtrC family, response regulator AtoC
MNQLENKAKANRNGNGSQLAGIDTSDGSIATEHSPADPLKGETVLADHHPVESANADSANADSANMDPHFSLRSLRAEAEIYAISRTLEYTGWNRRRAAQLLSISYRGILYKIRQHNLTPGPGREVVVMGQSLKVE